MYSSLYYIYEMWIALLMIQKILRTVLLTSTDFKVRIVWPCKTTAMFGINSIFELLPLTAMCAS
jgi:hypothetical protein